MLTHQHFTMNIEQYNTIVLPVPGEAEDIVKEVYQSLDRAVHYCPSIVAADAFRGDGFGSDFAHCVNFQ